jgi:hypothetical protein
MGVQCALDFADNIVGDGGECLTADEIAAIHLYTQAGPLYRILNARLRDRNREKLKPLLSLVKLLLHGLYKLPVTSTPVVYRGVKEDLSGGFQGKIIMWWSFSSSTTSIKVLENPVFFGHTGERTMFAITVRAGYDISRYSDHGAEEEVILPPGLFGCAAWPCWV